MKKNFNPQIQLDAFRDQNPPQLLASYLIDEFYSKDHPRLLHTHNNKLELFFVHHGEGYYFVNDQQYYIKKGDLVVCDQDILHGEFAFSNCKLRSYCCAFTDVSLKGLANNSLLSKDQAPVFSCGKYTKYISRLMELIYLLAATPLQPSDACSHLAIALLLLIKKILDSKTMTTNSLTLSKNYYLAQKIKNYIDVHFNQSITLNSISTALNMDMYYLSHTFKSIIGLPPIQYVTQRKIGEAQSLLIDSATPIALISDQLGFCNPGHFNNTFKKYINISPLKYRNYFLKGIH